MRKNPTRQEFMPTGMAPAQMAPTPMAPTQFAPMGPTPMAPPAAPFPTATGPIAQAPFPVGAPTTVAPVRRVVHPTRYAERHTVTRYPIENIYPSHVHNVHHNVCEYYCCYPHTESHQVCNHVVDHCCPPPGRRPRPF